MMTDNRTTELLPCPHCGKVDTLEFSTRRELEDCPNFEDCEAKNCGRGSCDVYDNWDCIICSVYKGWCGASSGYAECPAKAILKWNTRAELGSGTCYIVKTPSDSDFSDDWRYRCSECGCNIPVNERDPETGDVINAANYFPNCGAKVVVE